MKKKTNFARIYLVRHGEYTNKKNIIVGYLPLPLSPKGKKQAKEAGLFLKKKNVGAIFVSPQKRTQETARIISQVISKGKLKVITDKDLHESAFGHAREGLTLREAAQKNLKESLIYWRTPARLKTGETFDNMAGRMLKAINRGLKKYPGKNLVFVSHRDPILALLMKISKRSFNDLHKIKSFCPMGSISEVWSVGKRLVNKTYFAN